MTTASSKPTVRLAVWLSDRAMAAYERGQHRRCGLLNHLVASVRLYWRVRNWWRFDVWWRIERVWRRPLFRLRAWIYGCPVHKVPYIGPFKFCWLCRLEEHMRRERTKALGGR